MKKKFSFILFGFVFTTLSLFFANKVNAISDFYNEIGTYTIEQEDQGVKYEFDKTSEKYNYKFYYSYTIDTSGYIMDNSSPISYFYGINENTNLSYFPIDSTFGISVHARMMVYKYNYVTKEFDFQSNSPSADATGSYAITNQGLYKVLTDGVDGTSRVVYIIYEKEFYSSNIDSVKFNKDDKKIEIEMTIKTPRNFSINSSARNVYIEHSSGIYSVSLTYDDYYVSRVDGERDVYNIFISIGALGSSKPYGNDVVINGDLKVEFDSNLITKYDCINYDLAKPVINEIEYYNKDLMDWNLNSSITYSGNSVVLPENGLAMIKVLDDTSIISATVNDDSCQIDRSSDFTMIKCEVNKSVASNNLAYKIVDEYDNESQITHDLSYDNQLLVESDELSNYINVNGYKIVSSFAKSSYTDIDMICLVYGNEFIGSGKCGNRDSVESSYHYQGDVMVVALDKSRNYSTLLLEDVLLTKGYNLQDFKFTIDGNFEKVDISKDVGVLNELVYIDSPQSIHNIYAKYGDLVEEISRENNGKYYLPSYLEILNNKYQDTNCASQQCEKEVEVYTEYEIGNIKQSVSMFYKFTDTLPYIVDKINIVDVSLEYGKFDINSLELKQKLYADGLEVSLIDKAGTHYVGKIISEFVSYTNNDGATIRLDREPYEYISLVDDFGTYLLECKVKLLDNIDDGIHYRDDIYAKSFFIRVKLEDTTIPTLTLLGNSNITIDQYDAYKDASAKCNDLSGCVVNVTYYKDEIKAENIIDEIDTKIAGKYIIRYEAVDAAGNKSFEAIRTVNVVSMDELDTTTIIIIVSVVVAFALFITIGIILERRKSRRVTEFE